MLSKDPSLQPFFEVSWKISNKCNMNCPYCVRVLKKDDEEPNYTHIALRINELFEKYQPPKGQLYITGGEPYLWPIESVVDNIITSPYCKKIRITSNMSLPSERYRLTRAIIEGQGREFLLKGSLHQTSSSAQIAFIHKCASSLVDVINIVVNDDNYSEYLHLLSLFEFDGDRTVVVDSHSMDINWMVERLTGGGVSERVKTIPRKSRTFQISNEGCHCSAGITTIRIEPNGDVKRCASTEVIGTIDDYELPKNYCHCTRKTCPGCYNVWIRDQENINFIHRFNHAHQSRGLVNFE